jgi:hypothetical protein
MDEKLRNKKYKLSHIGSLAVVSLHVRLNVYDYVNVEQWFSYE